MAKIGISGTKDRSARSRAHDYRSNAGFTLIELLVVLVIAALIAAISVPAFRDTTLATAAAKAARSVASDLAAARQISIFSNHPVDVAIDVANITTRLPGRPVRTIEGIKRVAIVITRNAAASDSVGLMRFYPDGSADGGVIELVDESDYRARIRVNWLTGRIEIDE